MKGIKRIAMLVAVMLVALSMVAVLASCGGDDTTGSSDDSTSTTSSTTTPTTGSTGGGDGVEDNPNLVKVTVVDQNNKPIKGATVQICQGETCFAKPIVTGNDGVGTREYSSLGSERLKAKIQAINGNEDYLVPGEMGYVYFGEGEREITIKVRKVIVNVFDQNDKAVEGAAIQLYQGEHAFKDLIYTDADGIAYAFIAISGEDIGAQVTEILSGSGYELDNEIVYFDPGMYEATVLVSKLTTYSVKITTMLGKPIYNAKVELFDVAKNRKQKTAYTDESGIARFENMDPNEYYVKVTIESPAFKIITEASDGKYMFGNSYTLNIDVIELEKITYTVNAPESLNGYEVLVFDDRFDFVHEFLVIENGKVTFEASNGNYVVVVITQSSEYIKPVIFLKNDSAVAEVTVENAVAGADANHPIYLIGNNGIAILPNEPMWYYVPFADGKQLKVYSYDGPAFSVSYGKIQALAAEGYILDFVADGYDGALFSITGIEGDVAGALVSANPVGGYYEPVDLNLVSGESIDGTVLTANTKYGNVYYQYTAAEDGVLKVTVKNAFGQIIFDGYSDVPVQLTEDESGVYAEFPVKEGDVVLFAVSLSEESEQNLAEILLNFGQTKKNYTVRVNKDFEAAEGITVILYNKYGEEIGRAVSGTDGKVTFESLDYLNTYYVEVIAPENYESLGRIDFGFATETIAYLSHVRDGSSDYPFNIDRETGEGTISVYEGGTTWLEFYVSPSFDGTVWQFILNSANAKFDVYYNDNFYGSSAIKDGQATFAFYETGKTFKVAVTTEDGAAENISYVYSSLNVGAGSTVDNAQEIEAATSLSGTIAAGQTVYFRFVGEACKLTVTVTGEGVTLKTVTFDMGGDYEMADAQDNTITVDNTMSEWVYFAINAEADGSYEITVTVE